MYLILETINRKLYNHILLSNNKGGVKECIKNK